MRIHLSTTVLAGLLLAAAACGSDDPGPAALSADEFRAEANAICADNNAKIGAAVGDLFATGAPDPAKMQPTLDEVLRLTEATADGIDALVPPADLQVDVDAMVAQVREDVAASREQGGPAYWSSEEDAFAETSAKSKAIGLDACASEGE